MRLAATMLLQALPLMVILFFLFPRIGPLWSVPVKSHTAKTGMSDTLRPGIVSSLTQSPEVAFRVRFDGDIPPPQELYWRGIVMSRVDGDDAWRSLRYFEVPPRERAERGVFREGPSLSYRIIQEPTQQNYLYGLRYARSSNRGVMHLHDYRIYSPAIVENEFQYSVQSWPQARFGLELRGWRRRIETRLPATGNPRTRDLAARLLAEAGSPRAFVDAVLSHFRSQPFFYTLEPPLLGERDTMDRFPVRHPKRFLRALRVGLCPDGAQRRHSRAHRRWVSGRGDQPGEPNGYRASVRRPRLE